MSQSEIFDALQFAADTLVMNGESAWEAALSAVEEMGAWDFDFWKAPPPLPATLTSLQDVYKQVYSPSAIADMAMRPGHMFMLGTPSGKSGSYVVEHVDKNAGVITFASTPTWRREWMNAVLA